MAWYDSDEKFPLYSSVQWIKCLMHNHFTLDEFKLNFHIQICSSEQQPPTLGFIL